MIKKRINYMGNIGILTVGIISRNGQPFVEECLESLSNSLAPLLDCFDSINCILVDSDSTDKTLEEMLVFVDKNKFIKTDVYLIEGHCNAAIARNVILRNCTGEFVFLCDGDIVINYKFIVSAVEKIINGKADAVVGRLSEKWYDSEFKIHTSIPVRGKIEEEKFVRMAGGIILLSKEVVQSGIKYDEKLRFKQDGDFCLRVSESFNILKIPAFMGTHITQPYDSDERFKAFLKDNYNKYLGILYRNHMCSWKNIIRIARAEKGVTAGFIYVLLFLFSSIFCLQGVCIPLLLVSCVFLADFVRHVSQDRLRSFIMTRLVSPIMVIQGFFSKRVNGHRYSVKKINE